MFRAALLIACAIVSPVVSGKDLAIIRSAADGAWSAPATWEGGVVPGQGARVQILPDHDVLYDVVSEKAIRVVHVAGSLKFATDRDTRLDVGLLRIEAGTEWKEDGFDCHHIPPAPDPAAPRATLEIGTAEHPVSAGHRALIRLTHFEGADTECLPAIICLGGKMDIHGAPMARTWVKLDRSAAPGESLLFLADSTDGWQAGDKVVITATNRQRPFAGNITKHITESPLTEERTIKAFAADSMAPRGVEPQKLIILDRAVDFLHSASDGYAAEVANLSRNVVIESADPEGVRGHTMYHRHSSGSIGYAEFRHLGKEGVLGRYPIHFHLTGDTMRGSSVTGASIWDSGNRWVTLHGSQYMVVRDCVGYRSTGHGFFLENGQEVYNVFDRNLAIQALVGAPLPEQALPYDRNDGSGFWWANSRNVFTRNVATECDQHGFRFEAEKTATFDPVIAVPRTDGSVETTDLRTIPFLRFDDNEIHAQRRFAMNLGGIRGMVFNLYGDQPESIGGSVDGIGPDRHHPFIIRNLKVWDSHWSFHCGSPSVLVDGMDLHDGQYGIWRSVMTRHEYRNLTLGRFDSSPIFFPMAEPEPESIRLEEGKPTFPQILPVDDLPPATVITSVIRSGKSIEIHGTAIDNGGVSSVMVNGTAAHADRPDFAEWSLTLDAAAAGEKGITATARDTSGIAEAAPHTVAIPPLSAN